jgi:hypothetical protein
MEIFRFKLLFFFKNYNVPDAGLDSILHGLSSCSPGTSNFSFEKSMFSDILERVSEI